MQLTYRDELMNETPPAPDCRETSMPFPGRGGIGEDTVADEVRKILALAFECFDTWLKPMLLQAERQGPSPIEECDPYVEGLLRHLRRWGED